MDGEGADGMIRSFVIMTAGGMECCSPASLLLSLSLSLSLLLSFSLSFSHTHSLYLFLSLYLLDLSPSNAFASRQTK